MLEQKFPKVSNYCLLNFSEIETSFSFLMCFTNDYDDNDYNDDDCDSDSDDDDNDCDYEDDGENHGQRQTFGTLG